jgi:hypothetical protein
MTAPHSGYLLGGRTLAYRDALGRCTRLDADAIVLRRGSQKIALVEADLFAITAELQSDVAAKSRTVASRGLRSTFAKS